MADETQDPVTERPKREPPTIDLQATETPEPGAAAAAPDAEPAAVKSGSRKWALIGGGGVAVAVAALIGAGLWSVMPGPVADTGPSDTADRLARLETQLRDLAARPVPQPDTKATEALAARLGRVETALANPTNNSDAAIANRLAAAEAETKTFANGLANLNRRADETAAALREARAQNEALTKTVADLSKQNTGTVGRGDLDALAGRIATLETTAKSLGDALAKASSADRAGRQATVALALKSAVDRGAPFRAELGALKPFAGDQQSIAALEPFIDSGIPSVAALIKDFAARLPEIQQSVQVTPVGTGFMERLQANAERLVRVRPLNDAKGDDGAAVTARLESRIAQNDLPGVVTEAGKLPPAVRASIEPLLAKAAARSGAVAAAERLVTDALAGLAQPSAQR